MNIVVSDKVAQARHGEHAHRGQDAEGSHRDHRRIEGLGHGREKQGRSFTTSRRPRRKPRSRRKAATTPSAMPRRKRPCRCSTTQLQSGVAPQFDQRTNTIFFARTVRTWRRSSSSSRRIDKPTQQVMIEARLVEVTANPKQSYGINWGGVVGSSATPQTFRYGGSHPGHRPRSTCRPIPTTGAGARPSQCPRHAASDVTTLPTAPFADRFPPERRGSAAASARARRPVRDSLRSACPPPCAC